MAKGHEPEVLRVRAKPGVLALDHRALPARRFIGRDHKPDPNGPGLSLGHIAPGLYDPGKLHGGEPVDVDELFPIREEHDELVFHTNHKHPHHAHHAREHHRKVMKLVADGALIAHDEHTAKKCGVKFDAPQAEAPKADAELDDRAVPVEDHDTDAPKADEEPSK